MKKSNYVFQFIFIAFITSSLSVYGQIGTVVEFQKISMISGNFTGDLDIEDNFCRVANIGDLNGDGFTDIGVGAFSDDDESYNTGAVWIIFLDSIGATINHQKISAIEGDFSGQISSQDRFGYSVCSIGDLNGDEIMDIAVGAPFDDDGGNNTGAIWILFLNQDGTVKNHQKISKYQGEFYGDIEDNDFFGMSITDIGDFDNDGIRDIAVSASGDSDGGGIKTGALWFLYLNNDGTVKAYSKISATKGNFTGTLEPEDRFGRSCSVLGDIDEDGIVDIAVGAITDDDGGYNRGAVWILFLNADGSVKTHNKISNTSGNFNANLNDDDQLGQSIAPLGDIDGDGIIEIAVSCHNDDDGGTNRGAIYIIHLNLGGTVKSFQKISNSEGGFEGELSNGDTYSSSISFMGDLNNDGNIELASGSPFDDDGGFDKGAVWILSLETNTNSVSKTQDNYNLNIYPNPMNSITQFSFNSSHAGEELDYNIEIFSVMGTKVFSINSSFVTSYGSTQLFQWSGISSDGNRLDKGIYLSILTIKKGNHLYFSQSQKIVLQ